MKRSLFAAVAVALAVALGGIPAGAGTPEEPEITDVAGDANFVNGQSTANAGQAGVDTRPVSPEGADLAAIWFETDYATTKILDPQTGAVQRVVYTPAALVVNFKSVGAIQPTFGPSLMYRMFTSIGTCEVWFRANVLGSTPAPGDTQFGDVQKVVPNGGSCPGGAGILATGMSIDITGNVVSVTYPFSSFTDANEGLIEAGTEILPPPLYINGSRSPQVLLSVCTGRYPPPPSPVSVSPCATAPSIDEAPRFDGEFVVGSDVPAMVICADDPDHPHCE